jgi:TPR repeat protein
LKAGALAIAATVAAFVAVKNPLTVFANATASLIGISDVRSAPAPVAPSRQAMAAVSDSVPAVATNPTLPPSRDEIALALKTAHQNQAPAEIQQPAIAAAPVVAGPPVRRLDADELATLMTRAKALLAAGDIPPARLLLERAAEAQEASAALMLAQTYDPTVLGAQDIRNITPDPALARNWYQRAAQLGSADAQRRLSQLQ